jgi:hypothetical protein
MNYFYNLNTGKLFLGNSRCCFVIEAAGGWRTKKRKKKKKKNVKRGKIMNETFGEHSWLDYVWRSPMMIPSGGAGEVAQADDE